MTMISANYGLTGESRERGWDNPGLVEDDSRRPFGVVTAIRFADSPAWNANF